MQNTRQGLPCLMAQAQQLLLGAVVQLQSHKEVSKFVVDDSSLLLFRTQRRQVGPEGGRDIVEHFVGGHGQSALDPGQVRR